MSETGSTREPRATSFTTTIWRTMAIAPLLAGGGCINITAPDKPIEINLNISVTQAVVVKLDTQAKSLIQQNPGIF